MCGIVGAVSQKNVTEYLLESLNLLEYKGFDAANILVVNDKNKIERIHSVHRVVEIENQLKLHPINGKVGIANTHWSKRKFKSSKTTHPNIADDEIGLVMSGYIENSTAIKNKLSKEGYVLTTGTDSELVGYLIFHYMKMGDDCIAAMRRAEKELEGSFSICMINRRETASLKALRRGSNLVIGLGKNENYISSDYTSLLTVAHRFMDLEEGDIADISFDNICVYDMAGNKVDRQIYTAESNDTSSQQDKNAKLMLKEIYGQPDTIISTLQGRLDDQQVFDDSFGVNAPDYFGRIHRIQIVASGTSYHAGLVGRYWMEAISGIPCSVDIASETLSRQRIVDSNTLFVTLSQSGETAETLNALRIAKNLGYTATLTIGNAPASSLVKESDLVLITGAGTGQSVGDIKDFIAQLSALSLLAISLGKYHRLDPDKEAILAKKLRSVPIKAQQTLKVDPQIKNLAPVFNKNNRALYLGNGLQFPVAMEGATKLKQVSSIDAEAFLADEYPSRRVNPDKQPIVALAPQSDGYFDSIFSKIPDQKRNMIVFVDESKDGNKSESDNIIGMPQIDKLFAPMTYVIPMQLLAYHVGVGKGQDSDNQPNTLWT